MFWEIFNAVRANASIRLVLTAAERTRLLASLHSVEAKVLSQLLRMDMDKLKAANLQDKEAILDRFHDENISLYDVSCKICDCVRDLFCNEVISHAQTFFSDTPSSSVEPIGLGQLCNRMADSVLDDLAVAFFLARQGKLVEAELLYSCLLYTSPSPRDLSTSRMPSSA